MVQYSEFLGLVLPNFLELHDFSPAFQKTTETLGLRGHTPAASSLGTQETSGETLSITEPPPPTLSIK